MSLSRLRAGRARPSPWGTGPLASPESGLLNPDLLMSPPPGSPGQSAHPRPPHPSRFPRTEPKNTRTQQVKLRPPLCWSEREGCTITSAEGGKDGTFPNPKLGGGPLFIPGLRWGLGGCGRRWQPRGFSDHSAPPALHLMGCKLGGCRDTPSTPLPPPRPCCRLAPPRTRLAVLGCF